MGKLKKDISFALRRGTHRDVETTLIHHFNTYPSITASKAKPFSDGTQADILLSGITTIDNPAARNLYLDVTSTNPSPVGCQITTSVTR